jgi:hypothetical protein
MKTLKFFHSLYIANRFGTALLFVNFFFTFKVFIRLALLISKCWLVAWSVDW